MDVDCITIKSGSLEHCQ